MEFEILIRDSIVSCKGDASTMFAILKSLKEMANNPSLEFGTKS